MEAGHVPWSSLGRSEVVQAEGLSVRWPPLLNLRLVPIQESKMFRE